MVMSHCECQSLLMYVELVYSSMLMWHYDIHQGLCHISMLLKSDVGLRRGIILVAKF
jgi:hypothetical protein